MRFEPGEVVCDPACGTGGFLLAAHEFIPRHHKLDKAQLRFLNTEQLRAVELGFQGEFRQREDLLRVDE